MIAGTNGRTYVRLIDKLRSYPIPSLPIECKPGGLFLDIGCGWGRWMVAAGQRGYVPIGIDIKFDGALATAQVLKEFGLHGYTVVGDLEALPFATGSFDFVWSFSVIQHVHRDRARSCIRDVARVLKPGGDCKLEFPVRTGLRNRRQAARAAVNENNYTSWCVRYYTIGGLRDLFISEFGNFDYEAHCYFGIGFQAVDLRFVPWRFKPVIAASLGLTAMANELPPLKRMADSIYVSARKMPTTEPAGNGDGTGLRTAADIVDRDAFYSLLRCPVSGEPLVFDGARQELIAAEAGRAYAIQNGIPILLRSEARAL